jgi:type IV pilus assembly protein PilW
MKQPIASSIAQRRNGALGLTLLELLIAMALGLGILVALSSVYIAAKQSFRFQDSTGRMQEDAAYALDVMSREIRMTGFSGCMPVDTIVSGTPTTTTTSYPSLIWDQASPSGISGLNPLATIFPTDANITTRPYNVFNIFRGFDSGQSGFFSGTATTPAFTTASSLFFAGGLGESVSLNTPMTTTTDVIQAGNIDLGWSGKSSLFIISDCSNADLFKASVTSLSGTITSQSLYFAHATSDGNAQDGFTNSKVYGTDSAVIKPQWVYYYIATRDGATTPSLYRLNFDGDSRGNQQEIVSNVESMSIHYGEASAASPMVVANWRTTAASVTDWSLVLAVRVGLMMVSGLSDSNPDVVPTSTTLLGQTYTIPAINAAKVRNEFSTTIVLRNRVAPR